MAGIGMGEWDVETPHGSKPGEDHESTRTTVTAAAIGGIADSSATLAVLGLGRAIRCGLAK